MRYVLSLEGIAIFQSSTLYTPRLVSEILLVNKLLGNHDIDIDDVRHPTSNLAQTIQQSIES